MKKRFGLLFVLLLLPLVLVGVVQSVSSPSIYINASSYGINVIGNGWTAYADVTIYYDVEDADHMVATVTANYAGNFQVYIPTNYVATVGAHTVIAVQGTDKATAVYDVRAVAPPDDRLLNPIKSIQDKLESIDTEIKAIEAKLDPGGSFYNFVNAWFGTINDTIYARTEALEDKLDVVEQKIDAVNAEQMLYSGTGRLETYDTGGIDVVNVVTNKTVKITVTYYAYFTDAGEYARLSVRYDSPFTYQHVPTMYCDNTNEGDVLTVTLAAKDLLLHCNNVNSYVIVAWWITVEGSPDTSVTVTIY